MTIDYSTVYRVLNSNEDLKNYYKWYLSHCISLSLPYHNLEHTIGMMYHIICLYENSRKAGNIYGFVLDERDLYVLLLSALFHDYNHSGGICRDSVNVETAKNGLAECMRSLKVNDETTEQLISLCQDNISATEYPYVIPDSELNVHQQILRECDILVVLYDDFFTHNIIGLYNEMRPEESLVGFIQKYIEFVAQSFKNMKLKYSVDLWTEETDKFMESIKQIISLVV